MTGFAPETGHAAGLPIAGLFAKAEQKAIAAAERKCKLKFPECPVFKRKGVSVFKTDVDWGKGIYNTEDWSKKTVLKQGPIPVNP